MTKEKGTITSRLTLSTYSLIVIFQPHNVILAEIITKLHFNDRERSIAAVAKTMIRLRRNVYMLALAQLQLFLAAGDVRQALNYYPVLAAPAVSLQAEPRPWLDLDHLDLKPGPFFQDFIAAPWSLVRFPQQVIPPLRNSVDRIRRRE